MKQVALIANFDGQKFQDRYAVSPDQFYVVAGLLHYPDALPDPGSIILETTDPIGATDRLQAKFKQTTDATPFNVVSKAVPANSAAFITAKVIGFSGTNVNGYLLTGLLKRAAGNAVLVGANQVSLFENVAAWNAAIVAVAGTPEGAIQVTGAAGTTVNWIVRDIEITVFTP